MKITDIDVDKILCVSVFSGRDEEDPSVVEDDLDLGYLLGISPVFPEEYDGDEEQDEE